MKRRTLMTAMPAMLLLSLPVWAELTKEDVVQIIRAELEPVKLAIAEMRGEIKAIRAEMAAKDDIIALQRETSSKFVWLLAALIGEWATLIAAIVTIPYLYGRADRERVKELEARLREEEKRIEEIAASVEALKAVLQREEKLREEAQKLAQERPEFAEAFKRIGLL